MPRSPRQSDTAFAIVLFTDMVGSTAIASELGDRRWRVLQAKHHAVIRSELRKHGGREIDTAGDGFFAAFSEGEAAIRCACAIRDAVMDIGLQVRCGLNVGQVEMNDGKPTGAAVVAAARIMTNAGDGEVLVSNVLRELLPGSTIEFVDAGVHELKGLDGSWHLFRVVAVDGPALAATPPVEELAARRASIAASKGADAPRMSRSTKILAGAAAFLVLAAGIAFFRSRGDPGVSTIAPNSIGILDLDSGEITGAIGPLEERPGSIAASEDAVWVTNPDAGTVTRIDADEQEVRDSIPVGENPTGIAVGGGAVWVVNSGGPSVSRISPDTGEPFDPIPVGNGPAGIAFGEGSVWVTNRFDGTISRIDPDTNAVVEIPVGLDPRGITVGFGSVWVGLAGSNTVVRVDPQSNEVTQPIGVGNAPGSLAVSADDVWVVNTLDDTVMRISPETNSVVGTTEVGDGPSGIAVVDGIVWVANEADGTLSRIEPGQTPVRPLVIGSVPQGLAGVNSDLWASVRGTTTSHRGGTLRLVSLEPPGSLDPAVVYDVVSWRLPHLLGDGLVAFEPIGGTNARLVPDLADSVPTPTDGGRTYTFELRPEIQYSNGEVVAPADFRWGIERGFRLDPRTHANLYGALVGGEACENEPRTCDLSRGIVTDDVTGLIRFHLVGPDPEFLYKLTLPFAYPVPASVSGHYQGRAGVPGTGPYMVEAPMTSEGIALVRNPYFQAWSPVAQPDGYVDRIEWAFGFTPEAQVEAVAAGEADVAFEADGSGRLEEIFVRFAGQVHSSSRSVTQYVVLDTESPPFDNLDVRRALNFALDRGRVVQILGGESLPSCQQLPPNFPGYELYCPYTVDPAPERSWTAPDLERAKRLIRRSSTAGMRVVLEYPPVYWDAVGGVALGEYIAELLDELGYRGSVRRVPLGNFYSSGNEFQMALAGFAPDYPAASNFIVDKFMCDATETPRSGFCDPRIDAMIDRAIKTQAGDPAASGALWVEIDHAIVNQAPFLWLANQFAVEFVSERVGNYQWSLQWGGLLNQLWVR